VLATKTIVKEERRNNAASFLVMSFSFQDAWINGNSSCEKLFDKGRRLPPNTKCPSGKFLDFLSSVFYPVTKLSKPCCLLNAKTLTHHREGYVWDSIRNAFYGPHLTNQINVAVADPFRRKWMASSNDQVHSFSRATAQLKATPRTLSQW
jgi:hypothetical protein